MKKPQLSTIYKGTIIVLFIGLSTDALLTFFLGKPSKESNFAVAYSMQAYGMLAAVLIPTFLQLGLFLPMAYMSKKVAIKHDTLGRSGLAVICTWGIIHILAGSTWIWGSH